MNLSEKEYREKRYDLAKCFYAAYLSGLSPQTQDDHAMDKVIRLADIMLIKLYGEQKR